MAEHIMDKLKLVGFPGEQAGDEWTLPRTKVDATLSNEGEAADAKEVGEEIGALNENLNQLDEASAKINGSYDMMTVGNAKQLTSNVGINDKVPYLFRTAGGANDIGDREEDTIVGGTVAWNQLAKALVEGNYNKGLGTAVYDNGTVSFTAAARYGALYGATLMPLVVAHKYLINADIRLTNATTTNAARIAIGSTGYNQGAVYIPATTPTNVFTNVSGVVAYNPGENPTNNHLFLQDNRAEVSQIDMKNLMLFDLTQMFGSTIADYIYSLEQANAGAGVAWFKKLFPKDYYEYNAGELLSVSGLQIHEMTGFNQFDEVWESGYWDSTDGTAKSSSSWQRNKNAVHCVPGAAYCFTQNGNGTLGYLSYYDASDNFISSLALSSAVSGGGYVYTAPANAHYMRFYRGASASGVPFCINLHWDGERDGEYEPYVKRSYPLDSTLTLRGIPKLDSSNQLYYDGDTYEADGTVTRRYGIVDLGTLGWTYLTTGTSVAPYFYANTGSLPQGNIKFVGSWGDAPYPIVCGKYTSVRRNTTYFVDKTITVDGAIATQVVTQIQIKDSAYTDAATFKAAMSGVYLVYELATPTTESADPFQTPQVVDDWGTEEYVYADGAFPIPVGHDTFYAANLKAKLEMAPDSPGDGDGDYIVRQTNGLNEYVKMVKELPSAPTTDGSYHLEVTVVSGTPTLTWVDDE